MEECGKVTVPLATCAASDPLHEIHRQANLWIWTVRLYSFEPEFRHRFDRVGAPPKFVPNLLHTLAVGVPFFEQNLGTSEESSFRSAVSSFSASPSNAAAKVLSLGIEAGFWSRSGNWTTVCSPTSMILRRTGSIQSWRIRWPEYA